MAINVEIFSKETIKPSSPTPSHLKTHTLSFLDQLGPPIFLPIILYYTKPNTSATTASLKESLSKCLTKFYPLAGRIKDEIYVDCNDAGVDYLESKVTNCSLSYVLTNPNIESLVQLLPCKPYSPETKKESSESPLLLVQVNYFDCEGIAIGVCVWHRVGDTCSLNTFVNGWSATARGDHEAITPQFDLASIFPPRDLPGGVSNAKLVAKRFVFNASNMEKLKEKLRKDSNVVSATRVEAVSAFLTSERLMEPKSGEQEGKPYTVLFTTNLRKRRVPPLHDHSFGNMYSFVNEVFTNEEESRGFVGRIKSAVRRINGEFVGKIESDGDWYSKHIEDEAMKSFVEGMRNINFSSWCRFDFYNADFGWGRPVWTSIVTMPYENSVFLLDTRGLDGIEAWVSMSEENMAEFVSDAELLQFSS
ncbi:hypothetical protein Scep_018066 [Stephania cephalantha]|uniref:Uncharacterized protein n=2 Tax=Stephania cephalantha TaxID=152367 RepID=A0AAP0IS30_9MAGN